MLSQKDERTRESPYFRHALTYLTSPGKLRSTQAIQTTEPHALVCVVDGDPAVRDSLATLMVLNGHEVLTFANGREFLDALNGHAIDFVVCEADLPDMRGIQLFRMLNERHPSVRFALLLSRTDPAAAALARSSGVHAVFHKPLVHGRLTSFVKPGN